MKLLLALMSNLFLLSYAYAGGGSDHSHGDEEFQADHSSGPVVLDEQVIQQIGIKSITIAKAPFPVTARAFGEVIPSPKGFSIIAAPSKSIVESIEELAGTSISAKSPVVTIRPIQVGAEALILRSPITGRITALNVQPGAIVETGTVLAEVTNLKQLMFRAHLHGAELLSSSKIGSPLIISLHGLRNKIFKGEVLSIVPASDEPGHYGEILASINGDTDNLSLGMTGVAELILEEKSAALIVPEEALLGELGNYRIYVRSGNSFEPRRVKIGRQSGSKVEILEGIQAGEQVVIQGQYQLQWAKGDSSTHSHDAKEESGHAHSNQHSHGHDSNPQHEDGHSHDHSHSNQAEHTHD